MVVEMGLVYFDEDATAHEKDIKITWYKFGLPQRHSAKAPENPSVPLINCRTMSRY